MLSGSAKVKRVAASSLLPPPAVNVVLRAQPRLRSFTAATSFVLHRESGTCGVAGGVLEDGDGVDAVGGHLGDGDGVDAGGLAEACGAGRGKLLNLLRSGLHRLFHGGAHFIASPL